MGQQEGSQQQYGDSGRSAAAERTGSSQPDCEWQQRTTTATYRHSWSGQSSIVVSRSSSSAVVNRQSGAPVACGPTYVTRGDRPLSLHRRCCPYSTRKHRWLATSSCHFIEQCQLNR